MGLINEVRLINISYNNGGIRINDESFCMNSVNTLLSLQNGGGKSVLVQMLTAPFVHKAYRRTRDRSFEGYFTGTKPSFILIEWKLDGGAGKMMNGFMIRKRPEETGEAGEERDPLEILGIISEYREACPSDIHNLPVVEKTRKELILKSFAACRQIFEGFKKERNTRFFLYDMGQNAQQRQYFEKLKEYRVDFREWENIIKKLNQKEGGLSDLFSDCRDERGLTEKWFLDAVEKKLDPDGSKMREFGRITGMHAAQCFENADKIKRRDDIRRFREAVAPEEENPEKKSVRLLSRELLEKDGDISAQEDRMCAFLGAIKELIRLQEEAIREKEEELTENSRQLEELKYEKHSQGIHRLLREKKEMEENLFITTLELTELEKELAGGEDSVRRLEIRREDDERQEEHRQRERIRAELESIRRAGEDLEPRREELGAVLHGHYQSRKEAVLKEIAQTEKVIAGCRQKISEDTAFLHETDEEIGRANREAGRLLTELALFDREEAEYVRAAGEDLHRNILGRYEEGVLSAEEERLKAGKKTAEEERKRAREAKEKEELKAKQLESEGSEARLNRNDLSHEEKRISEEREGLLRELSVREDAMAFVNLKKEMLFRKEEILRAFDGRIEIADAQIRKLQERETEKKRVLMALESGRIAELPREVTEGFSHMGIDISCGMEWLRKNGRGLSKNLESVRKNPFLPYALILTAREFEKLKEEEAEFYTEIPLPIILREDLEEGEVRVAGRSGTIAEFDKIRFLVNFNENLLDEDKLNEMLGELRREIRELSGKAELQRSEREEFVKRRELIRAQSVTEEGLKETEERLEQCRESLWETERRISALEEQREENRNLIKTLETQIGEADGRAEAFALRLKTLQKLMADYERYLGNLEKKDRLEKSLKDLENRKAMTEEEIAKCREECDAEAIRAEHLRQRERAAEEKLRVFGIYPLPAAGEVLLDAEQQSTLEAEYTAITEQYSGEVREKEKELAGQEKRLKKAEDKLRALEKRYGVTAGETEGLLFSEEILERQREKNTEIRGKAEAKKDQQHREDKAVSVYQAQIEDRIRTMEAETGHRDILPAENIIDRNYDEEIGRIRRENTRLEERKKAALERWQHYKNLELSLPEFEGRQLREAVVFEEDFAEMTEQALEEFRKILGRDLQRFREERQRRRNALTDRLNDLLMRQEFREEFYRKPLDVMLRTADSPAEVLRQIGITLQAYEDLMKKIEVDLSVIEEERVSIRNEFADYLRDVHGELSSIDSNSTIPVRDRTIKMLSVNLPDWQENEEIYRIRIRDYVDMLVKNCMELRRKNETTEEFIGSHVNVRELYDAVVGIGNVQIRLYKIEKQREYPISWAEVSKNSGGEGFLSSFVILSSLLHYIRKDENDLFADSREGKVLLMDNPFGITYSEHLLKPMMELAKKNHTQLICLTGLGGDSIYGRFDNIYVLNLMTGGLKSGAQYLRADHIRGQEPEEVVPSRLEVVEQLKLF